MDEVTDHVYHTIEKEEKSMATNKTKQEFEDQNKLGMEVRKSPGNGYEKRFNQDTVSQEEHEYDVLSEPNKSRVVSVEMTNDGLRRESTSFYDTLERPKETTATMQKANFQEILSRKASLTALQKISSCEKINEKHKYCVAFLVGVVAAVILITSILILLGYVDIITLKERPECTCMTNTSTITKSLEMCLDKACHTTNIPNLENVFQNFSYKSNLSDKCKLHFISSEPSKCVQLPLVNISVGEWVKVANIDMTKNTSQCPLPHFKASNRSGFITCISHESKPGCYSASFASNMTYSKVYGRVKAYQYNRTNSFLNYNRGNNTINDPYVDGVSITYGQPRQHIWTFASDLDQSSSFCPCGTSEEVDIPDFVGEDYFCDSGLLANQNYTAAFSNPLWDGEKCGCINNYGCCNYNQPPWFYKQLQYSTSDPIELRVCRDQWSANEDILVEVIDIYIHA